MNLISKVSSTLNQRWMRWRDTFAVRRLKLAARRNDVEACARSFDDWMEKPADPDYRSRYRLLGLKKFGFLQDYQAAFAKRPDWSPWLLRRKAMVTLAAHFLPFELDDNNYVSRDRSSEEAKLLYREFLAEVWAKVQNEYRFDAVASGNFGYYVEREFGAAVHESRTPFITVHKENLKTPGLAAFWEKVYRERRGPFGGTAILTYNDVERRIQINAGVARPEQVHVIGMPRLDRAHQIRSAAFEPKRPYVLFFSFSERVGLVFLPRKNRRTNVMGYTEDGFDEKSHMRWSRLWREVHVEMLRFAKAHPGLDVIIKTKHTRLELAALRQFLESTDTLPSNLKIVRGGDPLELLRGACAVIGFNSTALLEALAAGCPVVFPRFAEAAQPDYEPFVVNLRPAVHEACSVPELHEQLDHLARSSSREAVLNDDRLAVLKRWTGNPDGKSAERMRLFFMNAIDRNAIAPVPNPA